MSFQSESSESLIDFGEILMSLIKGLNMTSLPGLQFTDKKDGEGL